MITAIATIIIFLVLISLHEFGHFAMAKASGVQVLEFSIGMGPAIFKKQGKETLYSVRLLPIGGYCSLEGEDGKNNSERAFANQKLWKRFLVISAGAILNIILGYLISVVLVGMSGTINTPEISEIDPNAYISQSGIKRGDRIIGIDGNKVSFYKDVAYYLDDVRSDKEISVKVKRGKEVLDFSFLPSLEEMYVKYEEDGAYVTTSVNGVSEETYVSYSKEQKEALSEYTGKEETSKRYIIGFTPCREEVSFKNIFSESYHYTFFVVKLVYNSLLELVTGKTGIEQLSGPVGVAAAVDVAVHSQAYSLENLLNLVAMLTINLGIFNLLPIPALDGGRLVFLLIELIFRKPVPPEKEGMVHTIGMILLLLLAAVILFNDIMKLI